MDRDGQDDRLQDPDFLAQATGQMHRQQPGVLGQILGGAGGGGIGGALGGMLGGNTSGNRNTGDGGGLLGSPIGKAALGGIAAMAVRHMMNRR